MPGSPPQSPAHWQIKHLLEPICHHGCIAGIASLSDYHSLIRHAGLQSIESRRIGKQVRKTWQIILRRVLRNVFKTTAYRRFIFATARRNPGFLLTVPRLLLAYRLGSLDYAIIVAEKPPTCAAPPGHTIVSP